jgi:hypothetical protein
MAINQNVAKQKAINIAFKMAELYSEMREFASEYVASGTSFAEPELLAVVTSSNAVLSFINENYHLGNFIKGRDIDLPA